MCAKTMTTLSPFHHFRSFSSASSSTSHRRSSYLVSRPYYKSKSYLVHSSLSTTSRGASDPDLRLALQLATDSELYELESILFGPSYFSPLLKSIATSRSDIDYVAIEEDLEERENFIGRLESQFFFLAADSRSTLRGWRPSYRNVLLSVRKKLNIPCSSKLSAADLEAEIFLHLLQDYSSKESGNISAISSKAKSSNYSDALQFRLSQWKVQAAAALSKGGISELLILKGGSMLTMAKIYELLARKLSGKLLLEAANYQIKNEVIRKGGQLAAINLESRAALLAAKKGFAGAASRYIGLNSIMGLLGPVLWGTFLADIVIQMLGTDYARILRAIYAFAQMNILRGGYSVIEQFRSELTLLDNGVLLKTYVTKLILMKKHNYSTRDLITSLSFFTNFQDISRTPIEIASNANKHRTQKRAPKACREETKQTTSERRTFLSLEEAGLVEISCLDTYERFPCRLTISSLNLMKMIAEQEGCTCTIEWGEVM